MKRKIELVSNQFYRCWHCGNSFPHIWFEGEASSEIARCNTCGQLQHVGCMGLPHAEPIEEPEAGGRLSLVPVESMACFQFYHCGKPLGQIKRTKHDTWLVVLPHAEILHSTMGEAIEWLVVNRA